MSKKALFLAGIIALAPSLMVADCQKECCVDQDTKFIKDVMVKFHMAKLIGKKSLVSKEDYDKAVVMIKSGKFGGLAIVIINKIREAYERFKDLSENINVESAITLDEIEGEITGLFKKGGNGKAGDDDASLKDEMKQEKPDEKLINQI